jgi:hypothetical protein
MTRNTSVIWSYVFGASIVGLVSALILGAISIWEESERWVQVPITLGSFTPHPEGPIPGERRPATTFDC